MSHTTPYCHPAWIEIDLVQFKKNLHLIRAYIGNAKLCVPIKANAYGHGLIPIARACVEAGADYLAVACLQEAILLRQAQINIPILVVGVIYEEQIAELLHYNLEFSISSLYKAKFVAAQCRRLQKKCKVHVEIDTGMHRTGMRLTTAEQVLNYLNSEPCFELIGVHSHLATADLNENETAKNQVEKFKNFVLSKIKPEFPQVICHLANSGGTCNYLDSHLDMVRPGKLSFGYFNYGDNPKLVGIRPIFSVKAHISYFKVVEEGQGISYGHTYKTPQDSRIITVPLGYGDGYRRNLSNKGQVLIRGQRYPVVGTVCMDQFMVNIQQNEAYVGDEVVLLGRQGQDEISIAEMAEWCNTIPSEIVCGFSNRLPRLYRESDREFWEFDSLKNSTW